MLQYVCARWHVFVTRSPSSGGCPLLRPCFRWSVNYQVLKTLHHSDSRCFVPSGSLAKNPMIRMWLFCWSFFLGGGGGRFRWCHHFFWCVGFLCHPCLFCLVPGAVFSDRFHTCEGRSCLTLNIHIIDKGEGKNASTKLATSKPGNWFLSRRGLRLRRPWQLQLHQEQLKA